jgi:hypothetical protein
MNKVKTVDDVKNLCHLQVFLWFLTLCSGKGFRRFGVILGLSGMYPSILNMSRTGRVALM